MSITIDSCGVATLFVELGSERKYLWRNWQAQNYPFVCALLEELGKPLSFGSNPAAPTPRTPSGQKSNRPSRMRRRQRPVRS